MGHAESFGGFVSARPSPCERLARTTSAHTAGWKRFRDLERIRPLSTHPCGCSSRQVRFRRRSDPPSRARRPACKVVAGAPSENQAYEQDVSHGDTLDRDVRDHRLRWSRPRSGRRVVDRPNGATCLGVNGGSLACKFGIADEVMTSLVFLLPQRLILGVPARVFQSHGGCRPDSGSGSYFEAGRGSRRRAVVWGRRRRRRRRGKVKSRRPIRAVSNWSSPERGHRVQLHYCERGGK